MYDHGENYFVEFTGIGEVADGETITLQVTKDQYEEISNIKDTIRIEYKFNRKPPIAYHFKLAKSSHF